MSTRTRLRNAFETQLNGGISAGATSILLDSASGLSSPGYLVIAPEDASKREYISYTSISTNTLNGVTRGLDGSASGAQAQDSGAYIRSTPVHQIVDDIFDDIEALEAADTGHFGGTDTSDHPEATPSVRGFLSASDKTKLDTVETSANEYSAADFSSDFGTAIAAASITESQISDLDHTDVVAIHDNVAGEIAAVTLKGTPHVNDHVLIEDSEAANVKKRVTITSLVSAGSTTDHGSLDGLTDDDHAQYLLADGSRAISGPINTDKIHILNNDDLAGLGDSSVGLIIGSSGLFLRFDGNEIQSDDGVSGANLQIQPFGGDVNISGAGQVLLPDGTEAAPGLAWGSDPNTGFRRKGENEVALSLGGADQMVLTTTTATFGTNIQPESENAFDLGSTTFAWRRLYALAIYDEDGVAVVDLSGPTIIPATAFSAEATFNGGLAIASGQGIEINGSGATVMRWEGIDRHSDAAPGSLRLDSGDGYSVFQHTSSERWKEMLERITPEQAWAMIEAVQGMTYKAKDRMVHDLGSKRRRRVAGSRSAGFTAENVYQAQLLPTTPDANFVGLDKDGLPDSLGDDGLIAVLWTAVHDLKRQLATV